MKNKPLYRKKWRINQNGYKKTLAANILATEDSEPTTEMNERARKMSEAIIEAHRVNTTETNRRIYVQEIP